jgi:hypothetical protein
MFFLKWKKIELEFKQKLINGSDLRIHWKIDYPQIAYIILKRDISVLALPRKFNSKSSFDPKDYKIGISELTHNLKSDPYFLSDKAFWIPDIVKLSEYVKSLPTHPKYIYPDYKDTIKQKRAGSGRNEIKPKIVEANPIKKIIEFHEKDIKNNSNVFSLLGKVWFVKFKEHEWGLYPDNEKYKYIASLLSLTSSNLNDIKYSIYNSDLIARIKKLNGAVDAKDYEAKEELNESDLRDQLSYHEFQRLKDIGYDLLEKIKETKSTGKQFEIKIAERNFKIYQETMLNEYGVLCKQSGEKLYFKTYLRSSKEVEKLRQLVKNQIGNAIKDFSEEMPKLATHLKNSISTKSIETSYEPETRLQWKVLM